MAEALADHDAAVVAGQAADVLARIRQRHPRVHCITNLAATSFTANVLLAVGAKPSLTIAEDELADFVGGANALLINLGTLDAQRRAAIDTAVRIAAEAGIAWVLDPVLVDVSRPRLRLASLLALRRPAAIRANAGEMAALVATHASIHTAAGYASEGRTVLAVTGALDQINDGGRVLRLANGHELMSRVTAMGCVTSALLAACVAVEADAFIAAGACLAAMGVAGEIAGRTAQGPGTFQPLFIDALANLNAARLANMVSVA